MYFNGGMAHRTRRPGSGMGSGSPRLMLSCRHHLAAQFHAEITGFFSHPFLRFVLLSEPVTKALQFSHFLFFLHFFFLFVVKHNSYFPRFKHRFRLLISPRMLAIGAIIC